VTPEEAARINAASGTAYWTDDQGYPNAGWEFQPDSRDTASTLPTAPTAGTPATAWTWFEHRVETARICAMGRRDPEGVRLSLSDAESLLKALAAAREEGRAEVRYEADMNRAGYEYAQSQIEALRAEVATARAAAAAAPDTTHEGDPR
jgi:hypothetical protein